MQPTLPPPDGGKLIVITAPLTEKEMLSTIRPNQWQYLREDCGDVPDGWKARGELLDA
jgi:hypothetical protein